jgi:hypothetical protein
VAVAVAAAAVGTGMHRKGEDGQQHSVASDTGYVAAGCATARKAECCALTTAGVEAGVCA